MKLNHLDREMKIIFCFLTEKCFIVSTANRGTWSVLFLRIFVTEVGAKTLQTFRLPYSMPKGERSLLIHFFFSFMNGSEIEPV